MKNSYYLAQASSQGCYKLDKKRLLSCEYFCTSANIDGDDGATLPVQVHGTQQVERDYEDYESSEATCPLRPLPSLSLGRLETSSVGETASQGASILGKRRSSQSCKTAPIWRSILVWTQGGHINEIQVRIYIANLPKRNIFLFITWVNTFHAKQPLRILILLPLKNNFILTSVFIEISTSSH